MLECTRNAHTDFYPRSPCGERRESQPPSVRPTKDFYPRSPCGERRLKISCTASASRDFYPRSPCGERHLRLYFKHPNVEFLSTLSLRRATHLCVCTCRAPTISIHALLAESDSASASGPVSGTLFLSTLSLRRATHGFPRLRNAVQISIHALLAESDLPVFSWRCPLTYFYPRSPCGERLPSLILG